MIAGLQHQGAAGGLPGQHALQGAVRCYRRPSPPQRCACNIGNARSQFLFGGSIGSAGVGRDTARLGWHALYAHCLVKRGVLGVTCVVGASGPVLGARLRVALPQFPDGVQITVASSPLMCGAASTGLGLYAYLERLSAHTHTRTHTGAQRRGSGDRNISLSTILQRLCDWLVACVARFATQLLQCLDISFASAPLCLPPVLGASSALGGVVVASPDGGVSGHGES